MCPGYADADVGGWQDATKVDRAHGARLETAADDRIEEWHTIDNGDLLDAVALRRRTGEGKSGEGMASPASQGVDESEVVEA